MVAAAVAGDELLSLSIVNFLVEHGRMMGPSTGGRGTLIRRSVKFIRLHSIIFYDRFLCFRYFVVDVFP